MGQNLNATLDIGDSRRTLHARSKGLAAPDEYFGLSSLWVSELGSHRKAGAHHVSILDDHDHVSGEKLRFSTGAGEWQIVAGTALQLFTLGIPCIYYGTEQAICRSGGRSCARAFAGLQAGYRDGQIFARGNVRARTSAPCRSGRTRSFGDAGLDQDLPGFGPFGTAGYQLLSIVVLPSYVRMRH